MEELSIGSGAHLVHDGWLQVDEHGAGHILAHARLAEEGIESIVSASDGLVAWHLSIRLNAMFQSGALHDHVWAWPLWPVAVAPSYR